VVQEMNDAGQDRASGCIEGKLDPIVADQEKADKTRSKEGTDWTIESIDKRLDKGEEPVAEFSR